MSRQSDKQPWGRVVALLTACCVTLVGVLRGLEPEVVLLRAAGAALVLGIASAVIMSVVPPLLKRAS